MKDSRAKSALPMGVRRALRKFGADIPLRRASDGDHGPAHGRTGLHVSKILARRQVAIRRVFDRQLCGRCLFVLGMTDQQPIC